MLLCILVALSIPVHSIFSLGLLLLIFLDAMNIAFHKIMIYDNAIVYKSLKTKTVLFNDLDYMTNLGTVRYYRNIPSGYKFAKDKKQILFFKNIEFDHLEQFEDIFRAHPAVEKYEENPVTDPDNKILETY